MEKQVKRVLFVALGCLVLTGCGGSLRFVTKKDKEAATHAEAGMSAIALFADACPKSKKLARSALKPVRAVHERLDVSAPSVDQIEEAWYSFETYDQKSDQLAEEVRAQPGFFSTLTGMLTSTGVGGMLMLYLSNLMTNPKGWAAKLNHKVASKVSAATKHEKKEKEEVHGALGGIIASVNDGLDLLDEIEKEWIAGARPEDAIENVCRAHSLRLKTNLRDVFKEALKERQEKEGVWKTVDGKLEIS